MEEIIKGNEYLLRVLPDMCAETPDAIIHKQDMDGNWQHWFTLATPAIVPQVAAVFKKENARLSLISGYPIRNRKDDSDPLYGVCYHYILDGVVYTPYVNLYAGDPTVPTITPWYDNADWHEREMQELVGIKVKDQPGKTRLFLDPELDRGIIGKIVPLSVMMNGACTKDLWEHILSAKGGNQ